MRTHIRVSHINKYIIVEPHRDDVNGLLRWMAGGETEEHWEGLKRVDRHWKNGHGCWCRATGVKGVVLSSFLSPLLTVRQR